MFENFIKAIIDLDENKAIKLAKERIERGEDPIKILDDIKIAVDEIGRKYEAKEYFIADLVMAGEILKEISEILKPALMGKTIEKIGKIVIGTVEGDIHDIGKNIAITMLEGAGFEVIDLGVDVSSQKFVEAIKQHNPQIVGMSGLLTLAIESMKKTIDAIKKAELRNKVKIIIGGGRVDEYAKQYVGADDWSTSAAIGVIKCKKLLEELRR